MTGHIFACLSKYLEIGQIISPKDKSSVSKEDLLLQNTGSTPKKEN
jgi:hypothetical protein